MKVMVTGGAGFIGSHIVDDLVEAGHEVVVYDNFSTGFMENLHRSASNVSVVEGDILDFDRLSEAMAGCDVVSHQAAQLEIFLAIRSPEDDLRQNTLGTINVLRAAKQAGVRKLINASSACVYGQTDHSSGEDDEIRPNWAYGVSKLAAEKYAQIYNDYEGLSVVSLRYAIVYGEREWYRRVLPIFIKRAIHGQAPVVFGDGSQVRDFVYVGDLVRLHSLCMTSDAADGLVLNVGTGVPTTVAELATAVGSLPSSPLEPIFEDTPEGEFSKLVPEKKRNSSELKRMLLDVSRARELLGWQPNVTLAEGLRREYVWATTNLHRWQTIRYTKT